MSLGFSIILTGVWPYLDKVSNSSAFQMSVLLKQSIKVEIDYLMKMNFRRQLFFMTNVCNMYFHFCIKSYTVLLKHLSANPGYIYSAMRGLNLCN